MRRLALALLAACGGSSAPPPAPAPVVSLVAPRGDPSDVIVAQVNGRPVWGSCVAAQVAREHVARAAAVDQCVAFELLAQTAERRGLAADHEVVDAARTAMVSQLIATGFEDVYRSPADLHGQFDALIAKNAWRMHRPDLRASTYARVVVPNGSPPELDQHARAIADEIAGALSAERGLFSTHLTETAQRIATAHQLAACASHTALDRACLDVADYPASQLEALDGDYGAALFSIPEVGRIAPPKRTKWGWDVVLWTGGLPAKETTRDELVTEMFPEMRRTMFQIWVNRMIKELGVTITVDSDLLTRLDSAAPGGQP